MTEGPRLSRPAQAMTTPSIAKTRQHIAPPTAKAGCCSLQPNARAVQSRQNCSGAPTAAHACHRAR